MVVSACSSSTTRIFWPPARDRCWCRRAAVRRLRRKIQAERGALPNLALHRDDAFVRLDDAMHHGQTPAGAFADRLGGEETAQRCAPEFWRPCRGRCRRRSAARIASALIPDAPAEILRPAGKASSITARMPGRPFHGMQRVGGQVHRHLINLGRVGQHGRRLPAQNCVSILMLGWQRGAEEFDRLLDDGVQLDDFAAFVRAGG